MRVYLEIFTVQPKGDALGYRCWRIDADDKRDPNEMVDRFIQDLAIRRRNEGDWLVHSTSWRYVQPASIALTYLCYSELFESDESWTNVRIDDIDVKNGRAFSANSSEADVLAHGVRHLAFLVKNGVLCRHDGPACRSATRVLSPLTAEVAGRL